MIYLAYLVGMVVLGATDYANVRGALVSPEPWCWVYWAALWWANAYVGLRVAHRSYRANAPTPGGKAR